MVVVAVTAMTRELLLAVFPRNIDRNHNRIGLIEFYMKRPSFLTSVLALFAAFAARAQTNQADAADILSRPLSRADAVQIAVRQNTSILKGNADLRASYGIQVQLRAIALPQFSVGGGYNYLQPTLIESFPLPAPLSSFVQIPNQNWNADVKVQQTVYAGGRITSAFRSAKLTREQALLNYQTTLADTLLAVRVAYDDVLQAQQQVAVHESSVQLLTQELDDVKKRFDAGTVPQFDVLRAQVELANERPRLIQAKNDLRIGKNNLLNLLAVRLPKAVWEDVPLQLSDTLDEAAYDIDLPTALGRALDRRPELAALRKAEALRKEDLINAKSGYKPNAQIYGGYDWNSLPYENNLGSDLYGWVAGAQLSWNIFDGQLTRGKIIEAKARHEQAQLDVEQSGRQIELDVRTAYSNFIEAREVLDSQKLVQEQAQEALRLAEARQKAGTGTQLDVLSAQTALTQARTTQVQALHDYAVARSRLQRALGEDMEIIQK
jgi:outer membrane protein